MQHDLAWWTRRVGGSVFFAGYSPFASGTVGSAVMIGLLWFFRNWFNALEPVQFYIMAMAITAASIYCAQQSRLVFGEEDSGKIVIDECAGQFITFLFVSISWKSLLVGFLLFRFFDILKPFPANVVEKIEGGTGITLDDIIAGIYSNLSLLMLISTYHLIKGHL